MGWQNAGTTVDVHLHSPAPRDPKGKWQARGGGDGGRDRADERTTGNCHAFLSLSQWWLVPLSKIHNIAKSIKVRKRRERNNAEN